MFLNWNLRKSSGVCLMILLLKVWISEKLGCVFNDFVAERHDIGVIDLRTTFLQEIPLVKMSNTASIAPLGRHSENCKIQQALHC